jgi:Protein of unknown function (DUF1553)/Protein of unknown function (DUF1549)
MSTLVRLILFAGLAGNLVSAVSAQETHRAGTDWWSLQKIVRPEAPTVKQREWVRNPIDAFVLAKLEAKVLSPAIPADRKTWARRVTFDLTGLPPTPKEIDDFVNDRSVDAFDKLVDRLLASPAYGERWGRHWLDAVRFSESHGFEYDRLRENAWHYRDYVIKAFNDDKPYALFVQEQIAGDVLTPVTKDGITATGFLVAGPWDQAGHGSASPTVRGRAREDELEEMLGTVGQTFLGLTVNCARCHDHKFDPLLARDYYRLKAVFEGVYHGDRTLTTRDEAPAEVKTFAAVIQKPGPTYLLKRGDLEMKAELVTAGPPPSVKGPPADFNLAADAAEGEGRRQFAAWVVHHDNPLVWRVMANRVWQHHFGQGIVRTPNDFGFNGDRPTHPELLDWLAFTFREQGGSIKKLHRLIVLSAAYRQSAAFNPQAAEVDADNRLLWRFAPRRLEAEAVRDAMLSVSGRLNPQMGGPSFRPFKISLFNSAFYHLLEIDSAEFNRRSIYRMNVNSARDPVLETLDCPDPSVKTPQRATTTTPLQALALMNNSFIQRQAIAFADRIRKEAGDTLEAQIDLAYRLAFGRLATKNERQHASEVAKEHGMRAVCWAILNSSEFVYIR